MLARMPRVSRLAIALGALIVPIVLKASGAHAQDDLFGPTLGTAAPVSRAAGPRGGEADHVPNTELTIELNAGEVLTVGTCGVRGGIAIGDTTLAVYDPARAFVASNDDACGSLGSRLVVRAEVSGPYVVALGCYSSPSCGGRVGWSVGDREAEVPVVSFALGLESRALVGPEGQAALVDAWAHVRFDAAGGLVLRLSGSPMMIGGGARGGVLGGAIQLVVGIDLSAMEVGVGGGVATLSRRADGITDREVGIFALRARFGFLTEFHLSVDAAIGFLGEDEADGVIDGRASLPFGMIEITARAVYGFAGVWLGELGVVVWPEGSSRRGVGIAVLAGGGAVFYQPVCRFGLVCEAALYAGPHLGLGIHVRP